MKITHDYSYLRNGEKLIEKGYAEMDIHSLNFDRYYTEEEKENNRKRSHTMSTEQWNSHCEEISKTIYSRLTLIIEMLDSKYDIYQVSEEKSTTEYYKSDWDLYFWSNKGWNNKDYYDHMKMSFNKKRTVEQNKKLLNEILEMLEQLDVKNVSCRVQYTARKDEEKIKTTATKICESLVNKPVLLKGIEGKIKVVDEYDGEKAYGFFKKRVRKSYYQISYDYLVLNYT